MQFFCEVSWVHEVLKNHAPKSMIEGTLQFNLDKTWMTGLHSSLKWRAAVLKRNQTYSAQ